MSNHWERFTARLFGQNQFAIKLGLDAMRAALAHLGRARLPHEVILVAGTNGKGTASSCLNALLCGHGLRVGLYTSPHIIGLEERFRVDGVPCARERVLEVGERVFARFGVEGAEPRLTFFELTTLMAVELFCEAEVDVAIYEVGLGGRLDATNALEPGVSVITTIGLDHQKYLGDTLAEVAHEKLGIAREGRPLIIGPQEHDEARGAIDAEVAGRPGVSFPEDDEARALGCLVGEVERWGALRAEYQRRHYLTATRAAAALLARVGGTLRRDVVLSAPARVRWPGRLEQRALRVGERTVPFLLDAAHNPDGARALFEYLAREGVEPRAILVGAMKDKELAGVFAGLSRLASAPLLLARVDNPRAASTQALAGALPEGVEATFAGSAAECWRWLGEHHDELPGGGPVLCFGSIYLLGECLALGGVSSQELVTLSASA